MIFIIDSNKIIADCIQKVCKKNGRGVRVFMDAISAISEIDDGPELIFLDILLSGPDGFTFLNEMMSYTETAKIPIIVITTLNLKEQDLNEYGVKAVLNKETMRPEDVEKCIKKYTKKI